MVETPRDFAQLRATELKKLLARLREGEALTGTDLSIAASRASDARRRAVETHLKAAERFLQSAEVHERAAEMYEALVAQRESNAEARLRGMDNKAAAERKRSAADAEVRRAVEAAQRGRP